MNKISLATLVAVMMLLQGCAGIQQKQEEAPVNLKYKGPIKVVKVLTCYRFQGLSNRLVALSRPEQKYNQKTLAGIKAFLNATEGMFSEVGVAVEVTALKTLDCDGRYNVAAERNPPTTLVIFGSTQNMFGDQMLEVQGSIVQPGGMGRILSRRTTIIGFLLKKDPKVVAEEIMKPLLKIIMSAQEQDACSPPRVREDSLWKEPQATVVSFLCTPRATFLRCRLFLTVY